MPIYEYKCEECSFKFELLKNMGEDGGAPCPECQGHSRRIFSPMYSIWKGARFAGENISKNKGSRPKEQSVKKTESDKKPENGEKNDKPAPPAQ